MFKYSHFLQFNINPRLKTKSSEMDRTILLVLLFSILNSVEPFACPETGSNVSKCSCAVEKLDTIFTTTPEAKGLVSCVGETVTDAILARYSELTTAANGLCEDDQPEAELENEVYKRRANSVQRLKEKQVKDINFSDPKFCTVSKFHLNRTHVAHLNGSWFVNVYFNEVRLTHNYHMEKIDSFAFNLSKSTMKILEVSYSKVSGHQMITWAASFENLQSLKLLVGNIDFIDKNTFGRFQFRKLQELDLSNNMISRIADFSFFDMTELKALKLSGNNIHAISGQMLTFAPPPSRLANTKLLIDLSKNHISSDLVDQRALSSFLRPVNLDLSHNILNTLSEKPFKTFLFSDHRNTIDVKGNPFICDESNGWILKHILYMNYSRGGTDEDVNPEFRTEIVGDLTFLYERTKPDYSFYKIRDFICENNQNIFAI